MLTKQKKLSALFILSFILQTQVYYYDNKYLSYGFSQFLDVYYYDINKYFVFYIVLECVLNHIYLWSNKMGKGLILHLTLCLCLCSVAQCVFQENDALLYTLIQCSMK